MFNLSLDQIKSDPISFLSSFIDDKINKIWTCVVGEIVEYNPQERTVSVQPLISEIFVGDENTAETIKLPKLEDVPLVYLYGGKFEFTFPIEKGDECLVFFSKQCIDNWWFGGGEQPPAEIRYFDISDGFALVGVFSQKKIKDNELLEPIDNGVCIRQIDDTINLQITEENLMFYTMTDDKIKSELILDKEGNYTYNIYKDDDLVSEDTIDAEGVHTYNIYDGSDVSSGLVIDKETVSYKLKDTKFNLDISESELAISVNDKAKINLSESELAIDLNNKMKITGSDSSLEINANNQATVTIEGSTVSVELGANKIEVSSSGIVLDNGTCKVEVGSSGVNINNGALSIMP